MDRHSQHGLRAMVLAAVTGLGLPAAAAEPQTTIALHASDQAGVPADVMRHAQQEVSRIYRSVGVDVVWDAAVAGTETGAAPVRHLYLMIVPASTANKLAISRSALGVAVTSPTSRGRLAYILYNRIESFAGTTHTDVALVLGHTLAHEVGHLLLPAGHSATGLMRANWDTEDLAQAARGWLLFSPEEAATIRTRLAAAR